MPFPLIRLELAGMRETMQVALSQYVASLDADIQAALEAFCTSENLQQIIQRETARTIAAVIEDEVRRFYTAGAGRAVIKEAVIQRLTAACEEKG